MNRTATIITATIITVGVALLLALVGVGYLLQEGGRAKPARVSKAERQPARQVEMARTVRFTDVTEEAGVLFRHEAGARGRKYNPETFGPGAGWLDYDSDGRVDLLLVNGNLIDAPADPTAVSVLYRNLGDGRFVNVTEPAGLSLPFYGMGFVAADVDNDGDPDLFLYGLDRSYFLINEAGRFRDTTRGSGLESLDGWVAAAAFLDYDRDGRLDLFVGNYVEWSPGHEEVLDCNFGTPRKKYCPVAMFSPTMPRLFRGRGDGTFRETTREAGLGGLRGKALGVTAQDYDRDGNPDLFVANDSVPNFLLRNRGDGTFEERGVASGFATDADGAALAGMGIDAAWSENDGPLVLAVGNFSGEPTTFHVQEDRDYFVERSLAMDIGIRTLDQVTFGLLLRDFDLDGHVDLLQVSGHVYDVESITKIPYRQFPQLFLGAPGGAFREMGAAEGDDFLGRAIIGRAAATADYDGDGDLDLLVTENQGRAFLLRNDLAASSDYLRVDLRGTRSNRDAIGAEVTVHTVLDGAERRVRQTLTAASSYLSRSERQVTFGLRVGEELRAIEVFWPSGLREKFPPPSSGNRVLLVEGQGRRATEANSTGGSAPTEPDNVVVLRHRGVRLLESGRFEEALRVLEEAIRRESRDFVAQRSRLIALWRLRRGRELDAALGEIVRLFPSASLLVVHFGVILREAGYRELAGRLFSEAGRLDPGRLDVWLSLGNLAFDRRDHDVALRYFTRALELQSDSLEALTNIGKIHTIRKEYARALPFLEKAITLRPDHATALSTLGGLRLAQRKYEEAERHLLEAHEFALTDTARLEVNGNLGILYLKLEDIPRAIEHFERVLEIDPEDRQARKALEKLRG